MRDINNIHTPSTLKEVFQQSAAEATQETETRDAISQVIEEDRLEAEAEAETVPLDFMEDVPTVTVEATGVWVECPHCKTEIPYPLVDFLQVEMDMLEQEEVPCESCHQLFNIQFNLRLYED